MTDFKIRMTWPTCHLHPPSTRGAFDGDFHYLLDTRHSDMVVRPSYVFETGTDLGRRLM